MGRYRLTFAGDEESCSTYYCFSCKTESTVDCPNFCPECGVKLDTLITPKVNPNKKYRIFDSIPTWVTDPNTLEILKSSELCFLIEYKQVRTRDEFSVWLVKTTRPAYSDVVGMGPYIKLTHNNASKIILENYYRYVDYYGYVTLKLVGPKGYKLLKIHNEPVEDFVKRKMINTDVRLKVSGSYWGVQDEYF